MAPMCISPVSTVIFPKSETAMLSSFTFANIQGYRLRICPTLLLKVCLFSRANFYLVSEQIHVTPLVRLWPSLLWPDLPLRWRASPLFVRSRNANTAQLLPTGCPTNWITTPPTAEALGKAAITGHAKVRLPSLCNAPWESWVYFGFGKQGVCKHLMKSGTQATSRLKVPQLMSYVLFVNFGTPSHNL